MGLSSDLLLSVLNSTNETHSNLTHCVCNAVISDPDTTCLCPDDVNATLTAIVAFYPWDNPDNLIRRDILVTFEKVVTCGLNPLLLAVGLPSNVLNALVFKRQGLGDRMNVSLFSLALVDLFCVVFWFLLGSFCLVGHAVPSDPYFTGLWKWGVRKYARGFHAGFLYSSGCLTMLIAVERCLCVAMPLRAANLVQTHTMTAFIVATVLSLHLLCIIYPFKFNIVTTFDEGAGKMIISMPPTRYYLNHKSLIDVLENFVIMTVIPFVTFVVVTVATVITIVTLKRVMAWREGAATSSSKKSQVALVKMLVIVSCIYIVLASPNIVLAIVKSLSSDFSLTGKYHNTFVATHLLYLALGTVNSTVNFFVYFSRSSRFRDELFKILPCCPHLWGAAPREYSDVSGASGVTSLPFKGVSKSPDCSFNGDRAIVESTKETAMDGVK